MKKLLCILVMAVVVSGCGMGNTNTTYDTQNVGRQGAVSIGRIVAIQEVRVEGAGEGVGTLAGAAAGGVAGHMIGGNSAVNALGAIGGAVLGGVVGGRAGRAVTNEAAYEFIVRRENESSVVIVQSNELDLRVGDEVVLVTVDGKTRIREKVPGF